MKTQLLTVSVLAFALQGCAFSNEGPDAEAITYSAIHQLESPDETWAIGTRVAPPPRSPAPTLHVNLSASRTENLEAAFWLCDYVATTRGVEATPIAMCSAAYDELKTVKFGGDFGALLDWWKQNKPVEHRKVASERHDAAVQ